MNHQNKERPPVIEHLNKGVEPTQEIIKEEIGVVIQLWLGYKTMGQKLSLKKQPRLFFENQQRLEKTQQEIDELVEFYPQYSNLQDEMIAEHEEQLKNSKNPYQKKDEPNAIPTEVDAAIRRYDGPDAWK